jgi:DNA ligase 1
LSDFGTLFKQVDSTTSINEKVNALSAYFSTCSDEDLSWSVALFTGKAGKRPFKTSELRKAAIELSGIPEWLFEESYQMTGNLAETIAKILPESDGTMSLSLGGLMNQLKSVHELSPEQRKLFLLTNWQQLNQDERFIFNKLLTGGFRLGVAEQSIWKAISKTFSIPVASVSLKLAGNWNPASGNLKAKFTDEVESKDISQPYPFYLAYALDEELNHLGNPEDWTAEYKYDGIRSQLIVREGQLFIWSRGEELITQRFPEFESILKNIPDGTVMDGELLSIRNHEIQSFQLLQKRITRKSISKKMLNEIPAAILAYDLLEFDAQDIRHWPFIERRRLLQELCANTQPLITLSPSIDFSEWSELSLIREKAREHKTEGLMLKHNQSTYKQGRKKGDWWKWKSEAYTVDAVLMYAQTGHGKRANLYTDYTFGVWDNGKLLTFAKAYSGLSNQEIIEVDKWIKQHTIEKFGPVRTVHPELVFELAFEAIHPSNRHKLGLAVRFPRIVRWRKDKPAHEADTKDTLLAFIRSNEVQQ